MRDLDMVLSQIHPKMKIIWSGEYSLYYYIDLQNDGLLKCITMEVSRETLYVYKIMNVSYRSCMEMIHLPATAPVHKWSTWSWRVNK